MEYQVNKESDIKWTKPGRWQYCKECEKNVLPIPGDCVWECPNCGYGLSCLYELLKEKI